MKIISLKERTTNNNDMQLHRNVFMLVTVFFSQAEHNFTSSEVVESCNLCCGEDWWLDVLEVCC